MNTPYGRKSRILQLYAPVRYLAGVVGLSWETSDPLVPRIEDHKLVFMIFARIIYPLSYGREWWGGEHPHQRLEGSVTGFSDTQHSVTLAITPGWWRKTVHIKSGKNIYTPCVLLYNSKFIGRPSSQHYYSQFRDMCVNRS